MNPIREVLHECWKIDSPDLKRLALWSLVVLVVSIVPAGCSPTQVSEPLVVSSPGQVTAVEDEFGSYYVYVPTTVPAEPDIVVLVHGTPAKDTSAEATAHYYLVSWIDFAEEQGHILIVPAFNQENFSSRKGDHAMGGYRGLFGREISADEWVLRLVGAYQKAFRVSEKQFYLYGHSAGGQFVSRFLVVHPEVVKRAVITAAATYAQPDPDVAWPFGMGKLYADIEWDAETANNVEIVPDRQKWLAATQIPLTVIVGLNDTAELPSFPGQKGKTRFVIGRNWVLDMTRYAEENGRESAFRFEMIPGRGHSMSGLLSFSQAALISE